MTEVHVEQGPLDGAPLVFKDYGQRVRMAFDPQQISEAGAFHLLKQHLPRLATSGRIAVVHHSHA